MLKWGILGLGNTSIRFLKSLNNSDEGYLYAVASLISQKRDEFQENYPDILVYDRYEDIINDPQIDAIYIALKPQNHYHWTKEALLHHKAILCEKPLTLTYQQTQELCRISQQKNTFFMEAINSRFIPMINEIHKVIDQGLIGQIQRIETSFCMPQCYQKNIDIFDRKNAHVFCHFVIDNIATILDFIHDSIVDIDVCYEKKDSIEFCSYIELTFQNGIIATIDYVIDRKKDKTMTIIGEKGTITTTPFDCPQKAVVAFDNGESFTGSHPYIYDDFYGAIKEVHRCIGYIYYESPRITHQDSLNIIHLINRIKEKMYG